MEVFIAAVPGQAVPVPFSPAHMAYRIGGGFRLLGIRLSRPIQNGLMMVDCRDFDGQGDPACCMRQILGECRKRNFRGVICDFEGVPLPPLVKLVGLLGEKCALYVPESYAHASSATRILIPSALTTGTLERRLNTACSHYGDRLALAVEWMREDFLLPSSGRGEPISQAVLEEQIGRLEPAIFFDRGLCAHYYTYMKERQAHFVLFDTPRSIREKLRTAERMGVTAALLPPEAAEYGGQISE